MVNNIYAKAYTEVLEIIKYFPKKDYDKIPKEKIEFYKKNMDINYQFSINPEIDLSEQNVSKETGAIIVKLFRDYFATEQQKEQLKELIRLKEKKCEIEKREKYNLDDLFKNNVKESREKINENNLPIEVKKGNFFKRLIDYIKGLFIYNK